MYIIFILLKYCIEKWWEVIIVFMLDDVKMGVPSSSSFAISFCLMKIVSICENILIFPACWNTI